MNQHQHQHLGISRGLARLWARIFAATVMVLTPGCMGDPNPSFQGKSTRDWIESLADRDKVDRHQTIMALKTIGKDAVPRLSKALKSEDLGIREGAALALARIGGDSAQASTALLEALKDEAELVRLAAGDAVAQIANQKEDFRELLLGKVTEQLKDSDSKLRVSAVQSLARFGAAGVPALQEAVQSDDSKVRAAAINALINLAGTNPSVLEILTEYATRDGEDDDARLKAFEGMAQAISTRRIALSRTDNLPQLLQFALLNPNAAPKFRAAAAKTLGEVGIAGDSLFTLQSFWQSLVNDPDADVREAIVIAFKKMGVQELRKHPDLVEAYKSVANKEKDPNIRKALLQILSGL